MANKKLKELGILVDMDVPKISNRERSIAYDQSLKGTIRRGSSALPILADSSAAANVECMEALLDQEIDKVLKMKEAKTSKDKQVRCSPFLHYIFEKLYLKCRLSKEPKKFESSHLATVNTLPCVLLTFINSIILAYLIKLNMACEQDGLVPPSHL